MNINLHDITGQESGVILVDTGAGRQNVVANWGDRDGLPYFMPYYAETNDPFPFLFMDVADIHVDRPLVHKGRLCDEVAHDGFDDWNPLNERLGIRRAMHRMPIVERLDGRRAGELELKESPKWNTSQAT